MSIETEPESYVDTIHERIDRMEAALARIEETMNRADTTITTIAAEVKPTLDAMVAHPMMKAFGFSKRVKGD